MTRQATVTSIVTCPIQQAINKQRVHERSRHETTHKTEAFIQLETQLHELMQEPPMGEAHWVLGMLESHPFTLQCQRIKNKRVWCVTATDCPTYLTGLPASTWYGETPEAALRLALSHDVPLANHDL